MVMGTPPSAAPLTVRQTVSAPGHAHYLQPEGVTALLEHLDSMSKQSSADLEKL